MKFLNILAFSTLAFHIFTVPQNADAMDKGDGLENNLFESGLKALQKSEAKCKAVAEWRLKLEAKDDWKREEAKEVLTLLIKADKVKLDLEVEQRIKEKTEQKEEGREEVGLLSSLWNSVWNSKEQQERVAVLDFGIKKTSGIIDEFSKIDQFLRIDGRLGGFNYRELLKILEGVLEDYTPEQQINLYCRDHPSVNKDDLLVIMRKDAAWREYERNLTNVILFEARNLYIKIVNDIACPSPDLVGWHKPVIDDLVVVHCGSTPVAYSVFVEKILKKCLEAQKTCRGAVQGKGLYEGV